MAGRSQSRAAARYRSLVSRDAERLPVDPVLGVQRGQLRETAIRRIQRASLRDFNRTRSSVAPITNADGLRIGVRNFTGEERRAISANKTIKNQLNKVFKSFARLIQDRARRLSRPAYETGLFSSSWKAKTRSSGGVVSEIMLTNRAPYAKFVHFKGRSKRQTVVKTVIRPMVKQAEKELENELVTTRSRILDAIREAVLAGRR